MALLPNSSIQDWLQFDGTGLIIPSCQFVNYTGHLDYFEDGTSMISSAPTLVNANCLQVCNDSSSLFASQSNNLVTCGLWSTLLSAYTVYGPGNVLLPNENHEAVELFDQFQAVGLDLDVLQYASAYADVISSCFQLLYYNAKFFTSSDDGTTIAACTREGLFPLGSNTNFSSSVTAPLRVCLEAICSPTTLNTDLAGVGVVSSFLIQSGISIIALGALLALEWLPLYKGMKRPRHSAVITALVDFHKIQCFFSSTIQITALILFRESMINSAQDTDTVRSSFQEFLDTSILVALATSGFVPISLTLACISRYGRQSWYLLILSLITMMLATATLASSYVYAYHYGIAYDLYTSNMDNPFPYNDDMYSSINITSTSCRIKGSVGSFIYPLCGSSGLGNNAIGASTVVSPWMWAVGGNCVVWLLFCMIKHFYSSKRGSLEPHRYSASTILARYAWTSGLSKELRSFRAWATVCCVTWSLCFGGQFYLFSVYFARDLISKQWSFGQIIAVAVWAPSIVEYIYIEYNGIEKAAEYRYPSPLRLTKENEPLPVTFRPLDRSEIHQYDPRPQSDLERLDSFMSQYREKGL